MEDLFPTLNMNKNTFIQIKKVIAIVILVIFISTSIKSPAYAQTVDPMARMPAPGGMVHLSPKFTPAHLAGLTIHTDNALKFDFLIQRGDEPLNESQKKEQYTNLVKYFLASLTIPDQDQWVNLSPYEKNRIIKDDFGKTEMGRDLLAQDYMLKQITSSLIYPEDRLGKNFWGRVYERAYKEYGATNIPINTFNKVWIIPDEAAVYESGNTVYVLRNHLKVMLEQDYLSLDNHMAISNSDAKSVNKIGSQIVREIVLPELEKEVNQGKNFANLRQIYSGMILATWYKHALKESLLGKIYANKVKIKGVDQNPQNNKVIYQKYLKAFKKGVFNYIKEDLNKYTHQMIPRKYFSGGVVDFAAVVTGNQVTKGFNDGTLLIFNNRASISQNVAAKIDLASISETSIDRASVSLNTSYDAAMIEEPVSFEQAMKGQYLTHPQEGVGLVMGKEGSQIFVAFKHNSVYVTRTFNTTSFQGFRLANPDEKEEYERLKFEKVLVENDARSDFYKLPIYRRLRIHAEYVHDPVAGVLITYALNKKRLLRDRNVIGIYTATLGEMIMILSIVGIGINRATSHETILMEDMLEDSAIRHKLEAALTPDGKHLTSDAKSAAFTGLLRSKKLLRFMDNTQKARAAVYSYNRVAVIIAEILRNGEEYIKADRGEAQSYLPLIDQRPTRIEEVSPGDLQWLDEYSKQAQKELSPVVNAFDREGFLRQYRDLSYRVLRAINDRVSGMHPDKNPVEIKVFIGGNPSQRPLLNVSEAIQFLNDNDQWIIEGIYYESNGKMIVALALPVKQRQSLISRKNILDEFLDLIKSGDLILDIEQVREHVQRVVSAVNRRIVAAIEDGRIPQYRAPIINSRVLVVAHQRGAQGTPTLDELSGSGDYERISSSEVRLRLLRNEDGSIKRPTSIKGKNLDWLWEVSCVPNEIYEKARSFIENYYDPETGMANVGPTRSLESGFLIPPSDMRTQLPRLGFSFEEEEAIIESYRLMGFDISKDAAMQSDNATTSVLAQGFIKDKALITVEKESPLGGIDFNSANMNFQIKRDGRGAPLPLLQQDMAQLSLIHGFIPKILEITPAVNLPIISEIQQKLQPSSV